MTDQLRDDRITLLKLLIKEMTSNDPVNVDETIKIVNALINRCHIDIQLNTPAYRVVLTRVTGIPSSSSTGAAINAGGASSTGAAINAGGSSSAGGASAAGATTHLTVQVLAENIYKVVQLRDGIFNYFKLR